MYGALWRVLPFPAWLKVIVFVVLAAAVLTACVLWVFPVINDLTAPVDATVGGE
jgi:hypothetical protein